MLIFSFISILAFTFLLQVGSSLCLYQKLEQAGAVALEARMNPPEPSNMDLDPTHCLNDTFKAIGLQNVSINVAPVINNLYPPACSTGYPPVMSKLNMQFNATGQTIIGGMPITLNMTTAVPVGTPIGTVHFFAMTTTPPMYQIWCPQVQPPQVGTIPDGSWMLFPDAPTGSYTLNCGANYAGTLYRGVPGGNVIEEAGSASVWPGDP